MKRQLVFAVSDIARNVTYYLRFFVQIFCVMFLFGICLSQLFSMYDFKERFGVFDNLSEVYVVRDKTDDDIFMERANKPDFPEKVYGFYSYINSLEGVKLMACESLSVSISSNEGLDIDYVSDPSGEKYYSLLYIEKNFSDIFDLSLKEGRIFYDEEYIDQGELTPVVLGYNYYGHYDVGDVIDGIFQVVGILNKDAFYLDPGKQGSVIYLDDCMIAPMVINEQTDPLALSNVVGFGTLITDDSVVQSKIVEKGRELQLFDDIEFISYRQQLDSIIEETMFFVRIGTVIMSIILLFCVMCLITSMMNYIDAYKGEFAVHLLCGATETDLIIRLVIPIALMLLMSGAIVAILIKKPITILALCIFSILFILLVATLPIIKIKNKEISGFLREEQND